MPAFHLHVKNVPRQAGTLDIRRFFHPLDIPDGGVQIVGGQEGHTFITFSNNDDLVKATTYNRSFLLGRLVEVRLVNSDEIRQIVEEVNCEPRVRSSTTAVEALFQRSQSRQPSAASGSPAQIISQLWESPSAQQTMHRRGTTLNQSAGRSSTYDRGKPEVFQQSDQEPYKESTWIPESDRHDIKQVDRMKHGLVQSPMDALPLFQRKQPPASYGSSAQCFIRPRDSPYSDTDLKEKYRRATTPPRSSGRSSTYDNRRGKRERQNDEKYKEEAKRMRLSKELSFKQSYSRNRSTSTRNRNVTASDEKLAMELDMELKDAQEMLDTLKKKKERIKKLEKIIVGKDFKETKATKRTLTEHSEPKSALTQEREYNLGHNRYGPTYKYDVPWHSGYDKADKPRYHNKYDEVVPYKSTETHGWSRYAGAPKYYGQQRHPQPPETHDNPRQYRPSMDKYELKYNAVNRFDKPVYPKLSETDKSMRSGLSQNYETPTYPRYFQENYRQKYPGHGKKNDVSGSAYSKKNYEVSRKTGPQESQESHKGSIHDKQNDGDSLRDPMYHGSSTNCLNPSVSGARPHHDPDVSCDPEGSDTDQPISKGTAAGKFVQPGLFFAAVDVLYHVETAASVWKRFGGLRGQSVGVLLLRQKTKATAYVGYENKSVCFVAMKDHPGSHQISAKSVYEAFAKAPKDSMMYKSSPTGEDVELSAYEKALLRNKFPVHVQLGQLDILHKISKTLFALTATVEKQHGDVEDPEQVVYLELKPLPASTTACQVSEWFGGSNGPQPHVLLKGPPRGEKNVNCKKTAYIAFKGKKSLHSGKQKFLRRKKEKGHYRCKGTNARTVLSRVGYLCKSTCFEISKSTDSGTDVMMTEEEKLAFSRECFPEESAYEEAPYILQIRGVSLTESACNVWSWFGREKGSTQGVTLMKNGQTRVAFVRFSDPEKCREEELKHHTSEVITFTEMLRALASCPHENIKKSTTIGDLPMLCTEWYSLVKRFGPEPMLGIPETRKELSGASDNTVSGHAILEQGQEGSNIPRDGQLATMTENQNDQGKVVDGNMENSHAVSEGSSPPTCKVDYVCFLVLNDLPQDSTAFSIWEQFGGSSGNSMGAILYVQKKKGGIMAFVAYETTLLRQTDSHLHTNAKPWARKHVYQKLAKAQPGAEIYKTVTGGCVKISESERNLFQVDFLHKNESLTEEQRGYEHVYMNKISNSLFGGQPAFCYVKLENLPAETTACEVWSWYSGAEGSCPPVIVTHVPGNPDGNEKCAYVKFRNFETFEAVRAKYSKSSLTAEKLVLPVITHWWWNHENVGFLISTDTGIDYVMNKSENSRTVMDIPPDEVFKRALYYVTLIGLAQDETATSVWDKLGGSAGPSLGAMLLEREGERTGFVAYDNMAERNAAVNMHEDYQAWSAIHVYKNYVQGPDGKMFKTSSQGDIDISFPAKGILNHKGLYMSHKKSHPRKKMNDASQQLIVNNISRTLFEVELADKNLETNLPVIDQDSFNREIDTPSPEISIPGMEGNTSKLR